MRFYETWYRWDKEKAELRQEQDREKRKSAGLPDREYKELEFVHDYDHNGIVLFDMSSMNWECFEIAIR